MASTTPRAALPYPASTDPNNVPLDLQRLATALDPIVPVRTNGIIVEAAANDTPGSAAGLSGIIPAGSVIDPRSHGFIKRGGERPGFYVGKDYSLSFTRLSGNDLADPTETATSMGYFNPTNQLVLPVGLRIGVDDPSRDLNLPWRTYTPGTFGNITGAAGSFGFRYVGSHTVDLRYDFSAGTATANGTPTYFAFPPGMNVSVAVRQAGAGCSQAQSANCVVVASDNSVQLFTTTGNTLSAGEALSKYFGSIRVEIT